MKNSYFVKSLFPFLIIFLAFTKSVIAANWTFVLQTEIGDIFYIDKNTIKRNGKSVSVMVLNDYGLPDPFNKAKSSVQELTFHCKDNTFQLLNDRFYADNAGSGRLIQGSDEPLPIMKIDKGSAFEIIFEYVCSSETNQSNTEEKNDEENLASMLFKNGEALGSALTFGVQNNSITKSKARFILGELKSVSFDNIVFIGSLCAALSKENCLKILVTGAEWPKGFDDYLTAAHKIFMSQQN